MFTSEVRALKAGDKKSKLEEKVRREAHLHHCSVSYSQHLELTCTGV